MLRWGKEHNWNRGDKQSWAGPGWAGLGHVTREEMLAPHTAAAAVITPSSLRVSAADILVCTLYTIYTFFFLNIVCQSAEVAATLNIHLAAAGG